MVIALTACGGGNHANDDSNYPEDLTPTSTARTLTILASYCGIGDEMRTIDGGLAGRNLDAIRQASLDMRLDWMQRGESETFYLDLELIPWYEWDLKDIRNQRLTLQMMAGDMPDIILFDGQNQRAMAENGFLVNFYDLIDQDTHLSRDDFFTQALSAFEIAGGLYVLPASFGFEYISISDNLPGHIVDRFTQKSFITVEEIMDLYITLMADYEEHFGHLRLGIPGSWDWNRFFRYRVGEYNTRFPFEYIRSYAFCLTSHAFASSILFEAIAINYIDFDTNRVDFISPGFASNMEAMRQIFERDFETGTVGGTHMVNGHTHTINHNTRESLNFAADMWVFMFSNRGIAPLFAFVTPEYPGFINPIPLTDNQGRLLISPYSSQAGGSGWFENAWANIGISAAADVELAWEFTKHLLSAYARQSVHSMAAPILRKYFEESTLSTIHLALRGGWGPFAGTNAEIIDSALQGLSALNEMPMALIIPMIPRGIYEDNLDLFIRGIMPADGFIQQLQNTVALWMIE